MRVPESAVREAWRAVTVITGDHALGIHIAESLPRGAFDLIEYAFRSARRSRSDSNGSRRYGRLINDRITGRTLDTGRGFKIVMGFAAPQPVHASAPSSPWRSSCAWRATRRRWS